ncbi:hypothetical protein D6817_03920 [Candidatus Pacearchaeota archaeon]|nr:MAG: hypothetical protein D6817_03920 [Candidatus Pacearchaeota archaeon]
MTRKAFFNERSKSEILDLGLREVRRQRGLVELIDSLSSGAGLVIRAQIIPGKFFRNSNTSAKASRKCYKHGDYIPLAHPRTLSKCSESPLIPLQLRAHAFNSEAFRRTREEEINFVGYSMRPGWSDRTRRVFPFVWMLEGARLFAYAENNAGGIGVEPYADARRVAREGASVVVEVPSRRRKQERYKFRLEHVPVVRSRYNLASVLTLKPQIIYDETSGAIEKGRTEHDIYNIRYTYEDESEASRQITFYPHDVAAYLGIIKHYLSEHNLTPMEMNPFALPSRHAAEFYKKLCNNVLIFDPSLRSKDQLRKLHIAEKSILLGRAIALFGHDDFAYWDPTRDGRLRDYDWRIQN